MTSEQARELFSEKGLTYENITKGDIGVLFTFLNKQVKEANKAGIMSTNTMRMSQKNKKQVQYNRKCKGLLFILK